jgi:adiponectin receptor
MGEKGGLQRTEGTTNGVVQPAAAANLQPRSSAHSSRNVTAVKVIDLRKDFSHLGHNHPPSRIAYADPLFAPKQRHPKTVTFDDARLPDWLRDNYFLQHGHRLELNSVLECLRTLRYWSNETLNIYIHLVGALMVLVAGSWAISSLSERQLAFASTAYPAGPFLLPDIANRLFATISRQADVIALIPTFLGALSCLSFSAIFHLFYCHSPAACHHLNKLDYGGIVLLISGSTLSTVYYGTRCDGVVRNYYLLFSGLMGAICTYVLVIRSSLQAPRYAGLRVACFTLLAVSGCVPVFESLLFRHSWAYVNSAFQLTRYTLPSGLLQLAGGLMYALRIPERFAPGRFDFVGHSHSNFHVIVVLAIFVHAYGLWESWMLWNGPEKLGYKLLGDQVCS